MIKYNDSNDETKVIGSWWKYEVHFKFTFTKKINIFDICLPTERYWTQKWIKICPERVQC